MAFEDFSVEKLIGRPSPARAYLWTIDVNPPAPARSKGDSGRNLTLQARTCSLPELSDEEITIPYMNSEFYIAGRRKWTTFDASFMENENGFVYDTFYQWKRMIYDVEDFGQGGYPKEYKSRMDVTLLTVKGEELAQWYIYGVWPTNVQAIDLDYESDDVIKVTVTFRFDYLLRNNTISSNIREKGFPVSGQLSIPGIGVVGL